MSFTPDYFYKEYGAYATPLPLCVLQLDPADRAVLHIADQRDAVQKKTFTKWVNKHLIKAGRRVIDLYEDFRDGHNLLSLLEVLGHEQLPRERGRMRFHHIQNVQIALEFLKRKGIKLVNIRADEIVDGNSKLTLGLVWTIILHFQVSDVIVPGQPEDITARDALLLWSRRMVEGYPNIQIRDFSKSWRDGKALLTIIHRNRPDLVDFRRVQTQTARQNLEQAFSTAEREFGVTRLLDPEDVDVPEPDEKSVMTYVSSLYDVFPVVPSVEQTLKENERQLKVEEYKDLSAKLLSWIKEVTDMMMQRDFPTTLMEMKALLAEFSRFRIEDVPPRLDMKGKIFHLFDSIETRGAFPTGIDESLYPENIKRLWNRFELAMQERERTLQAEIIRLERLQRLAEKIHRESRHAEDSLDDLGRRIGDEERRVDVIHPFEAKRNCDALDRALKNIDDTVKSLMRDIHALQDGKYPTADQLQKRVSTLQTRVSQLRTALISNVVQKLLSKSYVEEEMTTTKRREVLTEVRLVETNPAFRHVQECLHWIEAKQASLEGTDFGSDMNSVQQTLDQHLKEHQEILAFRKEVDRCITDKRNLSTEEQKLYTEWLSRVEVAFSLLTNTSSRRLKCLESLLDFVQSATQELIWLSEKEEIEVTRDWTSERLNMPVDQFYQNLIHEMENREAQFNAIQDRGNSMVLERHPAAKTIEAYMSAMQSQWSWLLQLSVCLEAHVKHTSSYYQFFEEAQQCEQWMQQQTETISNRVSRENQPIEELQHMMKELQEIQDSLADYDRRVASLSITSREIIPLKQRSQPVFSPIKIRCQCIYKQPPMILQKGEECTLVDNSQKIRWRVRNSSGQEELVPSVCLLIPPPNYEAMQFADRLKIQLDQLQGVFKTRQRRLRQNIVLATIKLIRSWDLRQFQSLDPIRREALLRVLNEDAAKLISEVGEGDREMRRLQEELAECNQKFHSLLFELSEEEMRKTRAPDKDLVKKLDSCSYQLSSLHQDLMGRVQQPLPHDRKTVILANQQQRDWERTLQQQELPVEEIKQLLQKLPKKTPQVESKLNLITQKWEQMINMGSTYAERLKVLDSIIAQVDSLRSSVADHEVYLASQDSLSSDPSTLRSLHTELRDMQTSLQQQQHTVDSVNKDVATLRSLVQQTRPGVIRHHDLEVLEKSIIDLLGHWQNVKDQVAERLKNMSDTVDNVSQYTNGLVEEQLFVATTQDKINAQNPVTDDLEEAKQLLQPAMEAYNLLGEHQHQIETVNRRGGQFIREAKIYDKKLKQYKESLQTLEMERVEEISKRPKRQTGADIVKGELDSLNKRYMSMVLWTNKRLKDISAIFKANNMNIQLPIMTEGGVPFLRTFRAELAKRSSMLVDEDMQEYFEQLADFEGYGGLQAMGKTGQTFGTQATVTVTNRRDGDSRSPPIYKLGTKEVPVKVTTSVKASVAPVKWRLKSPPVSSNRLSQKVASIASLSGVSQTSEDHDIPDSRTIQDSTTLIIVKQECLAPKGTYLFTPTVLNPQTGRKVNLSEAIKCGIFDTKTGSFVDPRTQKKMSLSEATRNRYLSVELQRQLMLSCGLTDPQTGSACTLLEAMQKELLDPVNISIRDPASGRYIPVQDAQARDIISEETKCSICGVGVTVTTITHWHAVYDDSEDSIKDIPIGLAEAVEKGLYDAKSGQIIDPISGQELTILAAVEKGYINPGKREIRDLQSGKLISLVEAVTLGIIDPEVGKYFNKTNGERMALDEAYQRKLMSKPSPLSRALAEGAFTESNKFMDTQTGHMMSLKDAFNSGFLDGDTKCIIETSSTDLLSISEAMEKEIIDSRGLYIPKDSSSRETLLEAVDRGHIKLLHEDVVYSKPCVKHVKTGKLITVPQAIRQGLITSKSNGEYIHSDSSRKIPLKAAASQGFIDSDICDKLQQVMSMKDSNGKNISILRAIQTGLIDPEKGEIRHPTSRKVLSWQQATVEGVISTEDAKTVFEILSPAIACMTVTTRLQPGQSEAGIRSVSVTDAIKQGLLVERNGTFRDPNTGATMPVETAIEKGLLRLSSEWPATSLQTKMSPVHTAASALQKEAEKWIKDVVESPEILESIRKSGKATVEAKLEKKQGDKNYSFIQSVVSQPKVTETLVSETRHIQIKSVLDPRTKKEVGVSEAVHRGLIDIPRGIFIHPVTEEKMTINDAISRGFIRGLETDVPPSPHSQSGTVKETNYFSITGVIHPKTGHKLTVSEAVKEGILDRERGLYFGVDSNGRPLKMKISEAVKQSFIIAEDLSSALLSSAGGFVHETRTYQLKSVVHPVTGVKLDVADAVRLGILDEHKGLYINLSTGEKMTIPEAIEKKLIDAELTSVTSNAEGEGSRITTTKLTTLMVKFVVDPRSESIISVSKAIEEGILDQVRGVYINPLTKETISINDAIEQKLILAQSAVEESSSTSTVSSIHINPDEEVSESNLVEEIHTETVMFSINSVIDPRNMELISYDDALQAGIINLSKGSYVNINTRESMPISIALEKGLIHGEVTSRLKEEDIMKSSVTSGSLAFPVKNITSVLDPRDGQDISVDKAIKDGILDLEKGTLYDHKTKRDIPLELAYKQGYIKLSKASNPEEIARIMRELAEKEADRIQKQHDHSFSLSEDAMEPSKVDIKLEKSGAFGESSSVFPDEVLNYTTDVEESHAQGAEDMGTKLKEQSSPLGVTTHVAVKVHKEKGESTFGKRYVEEPVITEITEGLSYSAAMKLGLIDKKSGCIKHPITGELLTLNEAIDQDLIDPSKVALMDIVTGKGFTLSDCMDRGIIDPKTGKINERKVKTENITLSPELKIQSSKEKCFNFLDAIASGHYDPDTGLFTDPGSGESCTLQEAVNRNLINADLVSVVDLQTGDKTPLRAALRQGLMDGSTGDIINPLTDERISLLDAIQQALVENMFDTESGTIYDTLTGEVVPLEKALTDGQLKTSEVKVFDPQSEEMVSLDVAFRKGLVDRRTGEVIDKQSDQKFSPKEAIKLGLLAVVGAPILAGKAVYDAVKEKIDKHAEAHQSYMYQVQVEQELPPVVNGLSSKTSSMNDDLHEEHLRVQVPKTTVVYAKPGDRIKVSPPTAVGPTNDKTDASILRTERATFQPGHLSDSFEKLVQDLNNKVNWISDIDQLLKDDQPVGEEAYKVQTQLEAIKALHHDLSQHQQPIRSLVYQSEQLVEHQQEELTPEQVTELQQLEGTLKTSFGKVQKTCDNRVKHLTSAAEELTKFEAELKKFQTWLTSTEQELKGQEEAVKDLDNLKHMMEQHQELSDDIIAHGADVKYLSFAVQKYMEEAKLHKLEIDAYKADRQKPSRLSRTSWIAMDNKEVEVVKEKQREAESRYNNLKPQCNKLGEKLAALSNKQKNFNENAWKMLSWLTDAEGKLNSSRQELSAPEPEALRDHLETIKSLGNDAIAHKVELDELDKSAKDLIAAMRDLDIGGDHIQKLEDMVEEIANRHESVTNEINDRTTGLQAAVTKSQDVQGAIENLLSWLGDTERVLNSQRPISLNEDNLKEQIQELNVLEADVDSHKPSVDSMKQAASELIKTCDHEMARALEAKISDINSKYMDVKKKCRARKKDVNDVLDKLEKFQEELDHCIEWLQTSTDSLQSVDWSKRPVEQLREKVDNVMQEKGKYLQALQSIQSQGNDLVQDPRTGETLAVKDSLKTMENLWNDFNMHLNERLNETNMKEKQGREYEACKHDVVQWLSTMESNVDAFEPVAVDMDVVGRQIEILQPMIEDYHSFSSKMDDVNDLGNAYDAVESGDHQPKSPIRFRGGRRIPSVLSPHNVHSQSSSFVIPSSPITNNASSPMSSDSSGISSRKSSSDNFLVDDLSETQQDLLDMNQRYELIGERLFDRQQELQGMLETIKSFLQDLSDILTWLDMKEQDLEKSATLPTSEKEAKHRLREHEISHQELLSKESMVDDIRKKAQDLMKRKRGVPGIEMVQQQLADLDDKWLGVKVTSEQRRKALEDIVADLRSYKDAGVTLQKWIAQKEKMVAVLGPVATDPAMIKNQQDQVKVLQEEQHAQDPLYDKFIESANAVLDKCMPDSKHAVHISEKISIISKGWDRLTDRLREREKSLQAVEGLSGEFNENLQQLGHWLADYATTLDSLSPIATSSEKQKQQLRELEELKAELKSKLPQLEKIKEVGKKLCDNTKDSSTKLDLRNKISNLEKPIAEAEKKLVLRENEIHKASQEVEKFHDSCKELLDWVDGIRERHSESEPVSANSDIIKQQAQKNKELLKDVSEAEPEMKSLLEKARSLARDSTNPELKSILDQLERAQSDLAEIRQQASEKDEKLEAANKHAQAFQNQLDKMGMWLDLNKDKLNSLKPDILDKDAVDRKLRDAQALQADLMRLATDHESLNQEGVALMSTADSDKGSIQAKLDGINRKWDDVKQGVANALLNLEDTSQRLTECEELKRDVEENLIRLEAELQDNREASKDPRNADKIKVLQDDVNDLNAKVDYLDALINTFSTDRGSAPPSQLIKDLGKTKERLRALQDETNHLLADMEAGLHIMEKFQDKLEESGSHLSELEQELNNLKPVARDEVALDNQKREIEEFISRLNDAENHLDDVEKQFNNLVNDGYVSHSDPLKSQIDGLRLQLEKLQEQAEERKANVAETANKIEGVVDNLRRMKTSIDRAANELEMHEPIASDVTAIKRQQGELKDFVRSVIEPLQKRFEAVTEEALDLTQTARPGVDTGILEADIDNLTDKWSSLSAKVSERDHNLDNALLQSGKFNEAFESFMSWLKESEDLVSHQKPVSPDYKVAKAQLQEQKFLLKMLEDRASGVKSVKDSGKSLQKNLDPREQKGIQNQIAQLDQRWEALNTNATERLKALESIITVAQDFQEVREPLVSWVETMEKKFSGLEPSALDATGIENTIKSLEEMFSDMRGRESDVKALALVGKELQDHCNGDEAKNVQKKIDDVQVKFAELRDKLSDTLEQMEEALPLAKRFSEAHAKFIDWIIKMEPKVRNKDPSVPEPEEQVQKLLEELKEIEPVIEILNNDGSQLAELAPGDAGFKVEDTVNKDMKRFEAVSDFIQKKADKFKASKQKSAEVIGEIDSLLDWFEKVEGTLMSAEPISSDPNKLQEQLHQQKSINEEINNQKTKARDLIAAGKRLMRENSVEEDTEMQDKMEALKQRGEAVAKIGSDKLSQLEQALPLARTFLDTHHDLLAWFAEVEPLLAELEVMTINQETVKKQQDRVKVLKQDVQDHKPVVDKLNRTVAALSKLYLGEEDLANIQGITQGDNKRVEDITAAINERFLSIDEALQQATEFTDKLDNILEMLTTTDEQMSNAEPISAHPDKIREQIMENNTLIDETQMCLNALESVQNTAEELIKQAHDSQDEAVKEVKQKLMDLVKLYEKIINSSQDRNHALEDTLYVAEKFWDDYSTLNRTLANLQKSIAEQEPPALEPAIIRDQQETLESLRDDIEASQFDFEEVHQTGEQLMTLCGAPDKPEVQKNIDDLDKDLANLTKEFDKRSKSLEEALEKAMHFQEELMKMLVWLQKREDRLREFKQVASEFDAIKGQLNEIKLFKADIDPKQVDVEALNHKASDLVKGASPDQAEVVMEPMATVNRKWEALQDNIGERQRMLQLAVLNVGQFEHAINELLSWMDTTEQTLDEAKQVAGDTKLIEIELSKHKMLQNDINAHESSVVSVREAGQRIIATEAASKSNVTKRKLDDMKSMWNKLHDKSKTRQEKLEEALKEAKEFSDDLQRTLIRLGEIEGMLIMSKPVGGLPETAKEQLEKFVEVYNEIGKLEGDVARIQSNGQKLVKKSPDIAAANIKQNLQFLQQRWDHIKGRAEDRKSKLEEAVQQANSFHSDLNRFITWLTDTEKILNNQRPVSRVIEQVTEQIEDHKALQKDIGRHREVLISLDKTGTHLKYFSQKQDVVLIKNLLSSVQHRWEKIVSRSAERTRHLEKGYREAKQFNDAYRDLMDWLIESDLFLDRENTISHDPVKLKDQIDKHKEFQKMLGAKQPLYDGVNRMGRSLKEKCPEEDIPVVQGTLNDLKKKWNSVCGKSVDRQRKLDEALIFTGQYNVALQTLLDWLAKVEPGLREEQPVHGDIDTVNNMVEEHKSFQQELGARANNVAFVRKRAKELMEKAEEDTTQQQAQLIELSTLWDRVCKLSVNKQERLEQAQKLAEDFDKKGKALLNWLATAERQLRYRGPIPDDEAGIIKQIEEHKQFEEELLRQEANLRETLNIGQDIMKRCHPDSVSTLKRWLTALRKRWEEITNWCQGRGKKLRDALDNVHNNNSLLEELIGWLNSAETRIFNANGIPIPNDEEAIVELLREHQDFMNDMSGKQPEVDRLTKSDKIRTLSTTEPISHIPVLKGLSGRRTPTLFNKYGSPRRSRDDDGRRTPEPRFRSPRIGALFNKWRQVWLTAMERQRKLRDALDYLQELEKMKGFKFDDWRKRYLQWMHHNKSRIMDFFRRQDHDRDGKVTRKEFIEGIMASKFPTSMLEMEAVANVFDRDRDGYIDYKEFVQALRPDNDAKPVTESEKIQDEVKRQVSKCTCVKQFKIHKIGEGKYRFGDSQKLRLVRILRSTVMVRVGGGWMALDEFLVKNDPCRARGRTNVELREQFVLAEGVSQSMAGFVTRSPSNSNSGSSTYSGASSPWSGQWSTPTRGPITKIREKTLYPTPWRENMKTTPDGEVTQIMSKTEANGSRSVQKKKVFRESQSSPVPRHLHSPGTPASRSSSRASTSSRPFSPTDSETSEASEPEVYTTVQSETRQVGGRKQTTMTYQTHVVQTRTVSTPTSVSSAKGSKIPKLTPKKK